MMSSIRDTALFVLGLGRIAFGLLLITTMLMDMSVAYYACIATGFVSGGLGILHLYDASRTT